MSVNPEYLRRNLLVCKAVGAEAGVRKSLERLRAMKRPPQWLVTSLEGVLERVEQLPGPLACYRSAAPERLDQGL